MPGFAHRYAEVNGTRLHYVIGGEGPVVVLLHGWPFTWREWRPTMPLLAEAGFTVVAPDLRGIGDSAKPATGYTKREVAEDLHQLGLGPVRVVGADIGAMVAHAWAAAYPQEVRRLVLAESVLPGYGLEEAMNPATGGYWHFGFHMQVDLAEQLTEGKEAAYLERMWALMAPGGVPDAEEQLRAYRAPGGMRGGFQHYATLLEDGAAIRATPPLPMPVLVLNGEHGLPQEPLLAGARRAALDVRADVVLGSAHCLGAGNPRRLVDRLAEFFA
ncbi:pimeloyl-ACP methyl ester carboxylesterase [Saccharothrix coeruleofusca]|uniref:alpha/beta fold hydrolase n=1 Tax=Saccharothrix coeruleofusca TaxID=33919 RepID=UPI001AE7E365|nr:alpha/beta hydrolase [Saccharothrix coeruleofusca]MBP2338589.1 pimeloyl-ACP methyl ester carboxylesterase [Saccharothrix coeruleofusca]